MRMYVGDATFLPCLSVSMCSDARDLKAPYQAPWVRDFS